MARKLFDNVRHLIATPGAGAIVLGTVPATWQGFAAAGAVDGDNPPYELVDGDARENGYLTLADSVTTATRTVVTSTNGGDPIELTGNAVLTCTPIAGTFNDDLLSVSRDQDLSSGAQAQGRSNLGATTTGSALMTAADAAAARAAIGAITLIGPPQGRLTLTSGVAVTTADVSGATNVYYTPVGGQFVPIHDGTRFQMKDIGGELTLALDSNPGHTNYHWSGNVYDFFVINDADTIRLGTGPRWSSGSGGTNTSRGTGATDIAVVSGIKVNASTITIRFGNGTGDTVSVAANRATYVGSGYMTANGQIDDTLVKRLLYNEYNQAVRPMVRGETATSWTYSTNAYQQANANGANQLAILRGFNVQPVHAEVIGTAANNTATFRSVRVGIGIDSSTTNSGRIGVNSASSVVNSVPSAVYDGFPGLGYHELRWLELGSGADIQTWYGGGAGISTGISGWVVQ